jgi:hypothetical protein
MTMANDGRDPLQKLRELQDWLLNNRPSKLFAVEAVEPAAWAAQSPQARAEKEDFHNWVQEINRPNFVW